MGVLLRIPSEIQVREDSLLLVWRGLCLKPSECVSVWGPTAAVTVAKCDCNRFLRLVLTDDVFI